MGGPGWLYIQQRKNNMDHTTIKQYPLVFAQFKLDKGDFLEELFYLIKPINVPHLSIEDKKDIKTALYRHINDMIINFEFEDNTEYQMILKLDGGSWDRIYLQEE